MPDQTLAQSEMDWCKGMTGDCSSSVESSCRVMRRCLISRMGYTRASSPLVSFIQADFFYFL
jgi:hypothetical protein